MTTPEKPLHVRVAEALGFQVEDHSYECRKACVVMPEEGGMIPTTKRTHRHGGWEVWERFEWEPHEGDWVECPSYDTDWSALGPVIERHGIHIGRDGLAPVTGPLSWWAADAGTYVGFDPSYMERGPTPLIAVCHLLLALHEAGKL